MNAPRQFVRGWVRAERTFGRSATQLEIEPQPTGWYTRFWSKARVGKVGKLTAAEARYIRKLTQETPGASQCFKNAQALIIADGLNCRLRYWEGYFQSSDMFIPVMHAWVTINGKVYDPTFDANTAAHHADPDRKPEYFGVQVPRQAMAANAVKTERYCSTIEESDFLQVQVSDTARVAP